MDLWLKLCFGSILILAMAEGAERCFACYSCNKVELSSQSIQCEDYQSLCMVKSNYLQNCVT
jgi:hypothetical protein